VNRPVLHLWPPVVRGLLPVLLTLVAGLIIGGPSTVLGTWVACSILLPVWARSRWLWWFAATVRRFQTISGTGAVLHLSPNLANNPFLPILLKTVEAKSHALAGQFGFRLRRTVAVYLFARTQDIANLFGPNCGALALPRLNAIILAEDCDWEEIAEHELAHLFAARWNPSAPPILAEGLAVWLQRSQEGRRVHLVANKVLAHSSIGLASLLDPEFFFSRRYIHSCYALAGSFTGSLISRFGWDRYRTLYRRCRGRRLGATFRACLGISLKQAERDWRAELRALGM